MWVTLTENVSSLGPAGTTVEVPEGYAVNFLFPQHLAFESPNGAPKEEEPVKKTSKEEREDEQLAGELDGVEVIIAGKIKNGTFVQPLTHKDVRAALKEMGYKVGFDLIKMAPITEPGNYEAAIDFPTGFEATVTVTAESISGE